MCDVTLENRGARRQRRSLLVVGAILILGFLINGLASSDLVMAGSGIWLALTTVLPLLLLPKRLGVLVAQPFLSCNTNGLNYGGCVFIPREAILGVVTRKRFGGSVDTISVRRWPGISSVTWIQAAMGLPLSRIDPAWRGNHAFRECLLSLARNGQIEDLT